MHTTIYHNKKFSKLSEIMISAYDRGLLLGDGLYETLRIYRGQAVLFDLHWQRLYNSAAFLEIELPVTKDELARSLRELIIKNNIINDEAGVRITLTRGANERGLWPIENQNPTLLIHTFNLAPSPDEGLKVIISDIKKNHLSPLAQIKSLNYLENILVRREAYNKNADEAILLNVHESLAEASTANIFIVKDNHVLTPKISDGALPGITRAICLHLCKQIAIKIEETTLILDDLKQADEMFLTNALIQVQPIISIDGKHFDSLKENSVTQQLQWHYQQHVENLKIDPY